MTLRYSLRHLAVLAVGYLLSTVAACGLIGHYRAYDGQPAAERIIVLFLLPVTATVIWALIRSLHGRRLAGQENGSADAAIREIVFWIVACLISIHTLLVGVLHGVANMELWASRGVVILVGVTLMIVGNYLPRTRPNMALGIRTSRTLADRQLWMLTHRATGYVAVALGLLTVYAGTFLDRRDVAALPGTAFLISVAVLTAFYWRAAHVSSRTPSV